jgi:hypothetical protein
MTSRQPNLSALDFLLCECPSVPFVNNGVIGVSPLWDENMGELSVETGQSNSCMINLLPPLLSRIMCIICHKICHLRGTGGDNLYLGEQIFPPHPQDCAIITYF